MARPMGDDEILKIWSLAHKLLTIRAPLQHSRSPLRTGVALVFISLPFRLLRQDEQWGCELPGAAITQIVRSRSFAALQHSDDQLSPVSQAQLTHDIGLVIFDRA